MILPARAEAAAVRERQGRCLEEGSPILPWKFLLEVLRHLSPCSENSFIDAPAETTARIQNHPAGLHDGLKISPFDRLPVDLLGSRRDEKSHPRSDLLLPEDTGRHFKVPEPSACAGTDEDLLDALPL